LDLINLVLNPEKNSNNIQKILKIYKNYNLMETSLMMSEEFK